MWNILQRYSNLREGFYSYVAPEPLNNKPQIIHLNTTLLAEFGLADIPTDEWRNILAGQHGCEGYSPLASVYMGHQFGVHVPQLGDGRAILIAEHIDTTGQIWELQLKGAGKTPYSRMGDGRAVLRSSIREYLVSHYMAMTNTPTTLATGLLVADDLVYREKPEKAATVLRAAPSLLRFGHFEYFAHQGKVSDLRTLVDFTVTNYFGHILVASDNYIAKFLQEVVKLTACMIAKWQAAGFVHGVMNTDNMSILGLTIDYGPYVFMDKFAPKQIYNHSDSEGRYVYANQPHIAWWNLYRLAEALLVLDGIEQADLQPILDSFADYYNNEYLALMWQKLGIADYKNLHDQQLLEEILKALELNQIDWTFFWRQLSYGADGIQNIERSYPQFEFKPFYERLEKCYAHDEINAVERRQRMCSINPAFVLRSHLLVDAIMKAEQNDFSEVELLFNLATTPYDEVGDSYYYQLPPDWAQHLELSCSS